MSIQLSRTIYMVPTSAISADKGGAGLGRGWTRYFSKPANVFSFSLCVIWETEERLGH